MESGHHIISLSLGGPAKPTGLAVIEPRSEYWHPKGNESELDWQNCYEIIHLERLAAGRAYPAIVARARESASHKRLARGSTLLVAASGTREGLSEALLSRLPGPPRKGLQCGNPLRAEPAPPVLVPVHRNPAT